MKISKLIALLTGIWNIQEYLFSIITGNEKIYLSSADWMVRNLSYRIETAFPMYDQDHRQEIIDFIDLQFRDNVKARILDAKHLNNYRENTDDIAVKAQPETYFYLKRKAEGKVVKI